MNDPTTQRLLNELIAANNDLSEFRQYGPLPDAIVDQLRKIRSELVELVDAMNVTVYLGQRRIDELNSVLADYDTPPS